MKKKLTVDRLNIKLGKQAAELSTGIKKIESLHQRLRLDFDTANIPSEFVAADIRDLKRRVESIERNWNAFELEYRNRGAAAVPAKIEEAKKPSLWSKIKGWFVSPKYDCSVNIHEGKVEPLGYNNLACVAAGETYRAPTETPRWVGEGEGPKWETKQAGNWSDPATWDNCASKFKR